MTSTPESPDPRLIDSHDLALAALGEITPAATIGPAAGYRIEDDGVVSLRFETLLAGYPGWFWTVSLARVDDADPTVLEAELLPGDDALLAPEWVPWSVRLADYQAQQAAAEDEADDEADEADEDELAEIDDLDATDFDQDGSPILHAGDVDGVDIDTLDDSAPADDDAADEDHAAAEDDASAEAADDTAEAADDAPER